MYSVEGILRPAPPFDLAKSVEFIAGMSGPGRQSLATEAFTRAVSINEQVVAFQLWAGGTIEEPSLKYVLHSEQPIDEALHAAVVGRITLYLSLNDDLRPFYELARSDSTFAPIVEQMYGYHQVKFLSPFEGASWAVLTQRNPMPEARKMKAMLAKRYGLSIEVESHTYWAFPEPGRIAVVSPDALEPIVESNQKAQYLNILAHAFDTVSDDFLTTAPYEEVEAWLRGIKGIGEWSATFIMLRALGRTDRIPLSERRLLEAVARVYNSGRRMTPQTIQEIADRYGKWQGYWGHYLRASR